MQNYINFSSVFKIISKNVPKLSEIIAFEAKIQR